jgi:nucleotide-binding universal stress UspA family protein
MKVLIATDGSEFSQAAIDKACELIKNASETEIKLVSVYTLPTIATEPFMASPNLYQKVSEDSKEIANANIEKARIVILNRLPNSSVTAEVVMGSPSQMIIETADEWKPDLIVVGSHGRGFWARSLLGSISDAVIHHAPCSVLVVRSSVPNAMERTKQK